jgi:hypothetical protein
VLRCSGQLVDISTAGDAPAHQFQLPSNAIRDGTRKALTIVASTSTPAAMPIPGSLMKNP